jgi:hypothetical protein
MTKMSSPLRVRMRVERWQAQAAHGGRPSMAAGAFTADARQAAAAPSFSRSLKPRSTRAQLSARRIGPVRVGTHRRSAGPSPLASTFASVCACQRPPRAVHPTSYFRRKLVAFDSAVSECRVAALRPTPLAQFPLRCLRAVREGSLASCSRNRGGRKFAQGGCYARPRRR